MRLESERNILDQKELVLYYSTLIHGILSPVLRNRSLVVEKALYQNKIFFFYILSQGFKRMDSLSG